MSDMESGSGSELVRAAREVLAGRLSVLHMEKVFARSTVSGQRPSKPGVPPSNSKVVFF
ncbi:MAG: hypothetical protein WKF73_18230 [Nocardioidaceae bacterium]